MWLPQSQRWCFGLDAVLVLQDKNPHDKAAATVKFQQIGEAYAILSDKSKRREYDNQSSPLFADSEDEDMGGGFGRYGVPSSRSCALSLGWFSIGAMSHAGTFFFQLAHRLVTALEPATRTSAGQISPSVTQAPCSSRSSVAEIRSRASLTRA